MRGEDERGDELNAAANLSVWKGIMPALNIAARLGRQKEREKRTVWVMHLNTVEMPLLQDLLSFDSSALVRNPRMSVIAWVNINDKEAEPPSLLPLSLWLSVCSLPHFVHSFDFLRVSPATILPPSIPLLPPTSSTSLSLSLCTCIRTSCIFPPCFPCIQSRVCLIAPAVVSCLPL